MCFSSRADVEFVYSLQLLKSLHFMMTSYDLQNRPGRWRLGDIYVRKDETGEIVYQGPDADKVPSLVSELMTCLNDPVPEDQRSDTGRDGSPQSGDDPPVPGR